MNPTSDARASISVKEVGLVRELAAQLEEIQEEMRLHNFEAAEVLQRVLPAHRLSAANLLDYLTLRNIDLREIQAALAQLGLSSLGRPKNTSLRRSNASSTTFTSWRGRSTVVGPNRRSATKKVNGYWRRTVCTARVNSPGSCARILVTMPTEAATTTDSLSNSWPAAWTAPESIARTTLPINGVKWPPTFDGRPSRSGVRALC